MRDLGLHLAATGHDVTYLTMRHWDASEAPHPPDVRVIGLTEAGRVYRRERRTLLPPLRFGLAVARHLWRHGRRLRRRAHGVVPVLPAARARARSAARRDYRLVVHWIEVWTRGYWWQYAGPAHRDRGLARPAGLRAHCRTRRTASRTCTRTGSSRPAIAGTPLVLPGLYAGPVEPTPADRVDPALVVYAGRHVQEKRVDALVRGFALAREQRPELRLELYGDGPERPHVARARADARPASSVRLPGHRPEGEVEDAIARAACLVTASEREGYGLVVVEAAARGTPSVVVAGPENAATELVEDGVNGVVCADSSPDRLADAIVRVVESGPELRESTARWFAENARTLRIDGSLELVAAGYDGTSRSPDTTEQMAWHALERAARSMLNGPNGVPFSASSSSRSRSGQLTCGDDGLVDYGGEDIWGICDSGGTAPTALWLGSAVPLAVLGLGARAVGPAALPQVGERRRVRPRRRRGRRLVAFFATAYGATVIVAVIWLVVLAFAVLVAAVETGAVGTSRRSHSSSASSSSSWPGARSPRLCSGS